MGMPIANGYANC